MNSTTEDVDSRHKINSELYNALMIREDEKKVIELCRKVPDRALQVFAVQGGTVLHMAAYVKRDELVLKLLDEIPDHSLDKMTRQDKTGNTIIHATATSNHTLPVADKLLRKAPGLLGMRNNNGESALFSAARYGKMDIFNFLAAKICSYDNASKKPFLQRNDRSTVLHIAIVSEHFKDVDSRHKINSELFNALMIREDEKKVIELCRKVPDRALQVLTIQGDTVLHMATYVKRDELVLKLLDEIPDHFLDKMTRQDKTGNTILHATATSNHALPVADKLLRKAPGLLGMRNNNGESALFSAARYGKMDIFNFLAAKICSYDNASKKPFLQRNDQSTVLHIAIVSQHFELALQIAKEYKYLIGERDIDGMTGLQLLSCKPEAFKRRLEDGFLKKLTDSVKFSCNLAWRERILKEDRKYESAIELAKFLIERDTSWEVANPIRDKDRPLIHKYGYSLDASTGEKGSQGEQIETPLFLATKSGCTEIVKQILKIYPQAVGHIDLDGRNILHIAIKYRQLEIFELVKKMEAVMRRLVRKIDNNGNTILHAVGKKNKDYVPEKIVGPALVLQEELLWYERVQEVMLPHFLNHRNDKGFTAEGFFASTNNELRVSSKQWLIHTAEGCSVVAVLIATVAFAAAYTVPGGSDESTGYPVLINHPFFVVFTISDVLSLTFSLASVVTFLSILTSPFRFEDFRHSLPNRMTLGFTFLFFSVCLMMVAFAATVLLMIKNKENWAKIMLYACSFIPVGVFGLTYFPVYTTTSTIRAFKYIAKKTRQLLSIPWRFLALKRSCSTHSSVERTSTSSFIP